jgi:AraC family ethanolamine operon transcriptional activator
VLLHPGEEFRIFRKAGFRSLVLRVPEALVERHCDAMFGRSLTQVLGRGRRLGSTDGAVSMCARHFAQICREATMNPKSLRNWAATQDASGSLAGEFLGDVFGIVAAAAPALGWSARRRIVDRAWELVDGSEESVTVADLCARLAVPIRTLDDAFRTCIGMPPKRFILCMKLNKVRRVLIRPSDDTTVTAAATRFGFYHFGHFASQYRRLFGESPSGTLARARGEAFSWPVEVPPRSIH